MLRGEFPGGAFSTEICRQHGPTLTTTDPRVERVARGQVEVFWDLNDLLHQIQLQCCETVSAVGQIGPALTTEDPEVIYQAKVTWHKPVHRQPTHPMLHD